MDRTFLVACALLVGLAACAPHPSKQVVDKVFNAEAYCEKLAAPSLTKDGQLAPHFVKAFGDCMHSKGYSHVGVRYEHYPKPKVTTVVESDRVTIR